MQTEFQLVTTSEHKIKSKIKRDTTSNYFIFKAPNDKNKICNKSITYQFNFKVFLLFLKKFS
jgi:hypothetical protein